MTTRSLFGGAIQCDIASSYRDISQLRDIKDSEEVYAEAETDSVFTIEILEYNQAIPNANIASFLFQDNVEGNEAKSFTIEQQELISGFFTCSGIQSGVRKGKEHDERGNDIKVLVAVLRDPAHNADLCLTLSTPVSISPQSSSAAYGAHPNVEKGKQVFLNALETFKILDYGLFNC